jgi:hypothetical protein
MGCLRAVDPDGCGIVDGDGVRGGISGTRCYGHEAGVKASDIAVHAYGLAWLVKGGLRNSVVASSELELHHVAHSGLDIVGRVRDGAG